MVDEKTALLSDRHACLLVIDMQTKLLSAINDAENVVKSCQWLMTLMELLSLPVVVTEQYPKGLGGTCDSLQTLINGNTPILPKTAFSVIADTSCWSEINKYQQFILSGIEASVCVLQTALSLRANNKQVFVVADAISGRHAVDTELAIARMRQAGVIVLSKEMVLFELCRDASHPMFKSISKRLLMGS